MKKMFIMYVLLILFLMSSVAGAEPLDESVMAVELYQAQSLANMKEGIYVIPEKVLNTYFSDIAHKSSKVKEATISVLDNNKLLLTIDAQGVGVFRLTCAIKELQYDKDNALLELYIEKKEMVGQSVASWFLNKLSVGFLADIYGNPLNGTSSKIKGNLIHIDLKPFASRLFKSGIGQSFFDKIAITGATTNTGVIYLHTNFAITMLTPEKKGK